MKTFILLSLIAPTVWLLAQVTPPRPPLTKSDAVLDQKIREIKARQLAQSLQPNLGGLKPGPLALPVATNSPTIAEAIAETEKGPTFMSVPVGTNHILLNLRTGAVELPKDVPLDDVAVGFWQAVAHAFPYAFDWEAMCSERSLWTNQIPAVQNETDRRAQGLLDEFRNGTPPASTNAPVKQKVLD